MRRLYRSKTDKMLGGVCGGLGESYGVDPTILRLAWVFIGILTGILPALITYIVAWIIIPEKPDQQQTVV